MVAVMMMATASGEGGGVHGVEDRDDDVGDGVLGNGVEEEVGGQGCGDVLRRVLGEGRRASERMIVQQRGERPVLSAPHSLAPRDTCASLEARQF